MGGVETWQQLGGAMTFVGIHFWPAMWGFLAAFAEFFGGIALVLGLGTRIASFLLTIAMVVAFTMHFRQGDAFSVYSFALTLIIVFLTFIIVGGGTYSLDHRLHEWHNQKN
jgi:putative oxidoreductase